MPGRALPSPMRQSILVGTGRMCLARSCSGRAIRGDLQDSTPSLLHSWGVGGSHSCLLSSGRSCQPTPRHPAVNPWWILQACSQRVVCRSVGHGDLCLCTGSQSALHPACPAPPGVHCTPGYCPLFSPLRGSPGRATGPSTEQWLRPGLELTRAVLCRPPLLPSVSPPVRQSRC